MTSILQCCADLRTERAQTHCTASSSAARLTATAPRRQVAARATATRSQQLPARCAFAVPVLPQTAQDVRTAASSAVQALRGAANNISVAPPKQTVLTDQPSPVLRVHSSSEFKKAVGEDSERLVVLMCKAMGCRPCKAFTRKYQRIAAQYKDCTFLDIYGDESNDTRRLMISLEIRVTPTFKLFRGSECIHSHGGINEESLRAAIHEHSRTAAS